jgi:type IX secretion system PorP/SprF family membrane protein
MKAIYITIFALFGLLLSSADVSGQDKHFSQFYAAPQTLNPALTGAYDGAYRIGINYRDQWRSVLDQPISTYSFSGDLRFELDYKRGKLKDYAAIGLLFFSDRVASFDLNTNQIALTGAYHKVVGQRFEQYLSAGYQIGVSQRNVNYENLFFEDQFNQIDAYSQATAENLPANNFGFADMALGVNYSLKPTDNSQFSIGGSVYHINPVNVSFWRKSNDPAPGLIKKDVLQLKYGLQMSGKIQFENGIELSPRFLVASQGGHLELNLGSNIRFPFNTFTPSGFYLGSWLRPVKFEESMGIDALVFFAGIDYSSFLIGLSYDANFTDLVQDQKGIGAFELSVTFLGLYNNESYCPEF